MNRLVPVILALLQGVAMAERLEIHPANPRKGDFVILTVREPRDDEAYSVRLAGAVFSLSEEGQGFRRGYAGIPLGTASTAVLVLSGRRGRVVSEKTQVFLPRVLPPPREVTVASEYVEPPMEVKARVEAEAALLKAVRQRSWTNRRWFDAAPAAPVRPGPGRQGAGFGERRLFGGRRESVHWGQDIAGAPADVAAVFPGRVVLASNLYYAGKTVFVHHGFGVLTQYSHLSNLAVREGEWVEKGRILGRMGMSGRATGPHLHFGAHVAGVAVDPLSFLTNTRRFLSE